MSELIHCVYTSIASASFNEDELPGLLEQARNSNQQRKVSGMLLYINGNFLQVLEGEASTVEALIEKIRNDKRHSRISLLVREPIFQREFETWSMGFQTLLWNQVEDLIGENDFFDSKSCLSSLDPGVVSALLSAFRSAQLEVAG